MTATEASFYLAIGLCSVVILFGLVGLLWGLAVAASDPVREDDGEYK